MIIVSFVVELVFQNLVLTLLLDLLLLLKLLVVLLKAIINVTSVVASGRLIVLGPLSETKPTETMLALLTSHVHTPLVLFNK